MKNGSIGLNVRVQELILGQISRRNEPDPLELHPRAKTNFNFLEHNIQSDFIGSIGSIGFIGSIGSTGSIGSIGSIVHTGNIPPVK